MKLPQHDQRLELWPDELQALAQVLGFYVHTCVRQMAPNNPRPVSISCLDALMLKPAAKLAQRFGRLATTAQLLQQRKPRRVRVEYDELLLLNRLVRNVAVLLDDAQAARLVGHIDQKSLNLTPYFIR